jgi:6-phosphogluconolactonase
MKGHVQVFNSKTELAKGAARAIAELLGAAVQQRGVASLALSGGDTPRMVYEQLGSERTHVKPPWKKTHLFMGDERCVPPDASNSNYRMVNDTLVRRISIPPANVHRIVGEIPPSDAAEIYEDKLKEFFQLGPGQLPVFDVILLGLGEDGHTASLFPGTPAVTETQRMVTSLTVEGQKAARITLTLPVINNARTVMFLVAARNKAKVLQKVVEESEIIYPAQMVAPTSGELHFLVDREAASQLKLAGREPLSSPHRTEPQE